jgi:AraC-like DNA-binding protein
MRTLASRPPKRPAFVSSQVTEASRYFLDLAPKSSLPLVVVCGGVERMRADYTVERRTFPYLCVEFVVEGAGTLKLRGKDYPLRPGIAFAYAPHIPHRIVNDPARPMRKYYVDFAGAEAARLLAATPLGQWRTAEISEPQEILDIFDALQRDALAEGGSAASLCAAHLRVLLLKIAQRALTPRPGAPRALASYRRSLRFIEEHFVKLTTAEEIARACHMTPVHLSRVFRRFAHTTPFAFLTRLKMNRAAALLLDSGLLVKEAAEALGYTSQFQFSRAFKRVHGLSPTHFLHHIPRNA